MKSHLLTLVLRWKQWRCEHFWRPAIKSGGLAVKYCDYCEKEVLLTDAEFYAQFGRITALQELRGA